MSRCRPNSVTVASSLAAAAADYPPEVVRDLDLYLLVARRLLAADGGFGAMNRDLGAKPDPAKPLSNMAMLTLLQQDMSMPDFTMHGFRSTFRDWAAECTNFSREVCEWR